MNTADFNGYSFKLFWSVTIIATFINVFGNESHFRRQVSFLKKTIVNNKRENDAILFHSDWFQKKRIDKNLIVNYC